VRRIRAIDPKERRRRLASTCTPPLRCVIDNATVVTDTHLSDIDTYEHGPTAGEDPLLKTMRGESARDGLGQTCRCCRMSCGQVGRLSKHGIAGACAAMSNERRAGGELFTGFQHADISQWRALRGSRGPWRPRARRAAARRNYWIKSGRIAKPCLRDRATRALLARSQGIARRQHPGQGRSLLARSLRTIAPPGGNMDTTICWARYCARGLDNVAASRSSIRRGAAGDRRRAIGSPGHSLRRRQDENAGRSRRQPPRNVDGTVKTISNGRFRKGADGARRSDG